MSQNRQSRVQTGFGFLGASFVALSLFVVLVPILASDGVVGMAFRWVGSSSEQRTWAGSDTTIRALLYACAAALGIWVWFRPPATGNPLFLLVMGSAITLAAAMSVSASARELVIMSWPWLLFFVSAFLQRRALLLVIYVLLALLACQSILTVLALWGDQSQFITPGFGARASGLFLSPSGLYPILIVSAFTFGLLAYAALKSPLAYVYVASAMAAVLSCVLTFSRSAVIGLSVGAVACAVKRPRDRVALGIVGLGLCLYVVGMRSNWSGAALANDRSAYGHSMTMEDGLKLLKRAPFVGEGTHAFLHSEGYLRVAQRSSSPPEFPKNLFLHLATCYGIPGLTCFVTMMVGVIRLSRLGARDESLGILRPIAASVAPSLVGILVAGMFDAPLFTDLITYPSTVLVMTFAGIAANLSRSVTR